MFKHYLFAALNHFRRHKAVTGLNVLCLMIGLGAFVGTHWVVVAMRSADQYQPNANRIYAITQSVTFVGGINSGVQPITVWQTARFLRNDLPELRSIARATMPENIPVTVRDTKTSLMGRYADPEFFDVFSLSFVAGTGTGQLRQPHSVVLTRNASDKLFSDPQAAIGQSLLIFGNVEVTVTGVVNNIQRPSHMQSDSQFGFDILVSMDVLEQMPSRQAARETWINLNTLTYVMLPADGTMTLQRLHQDLESFAKRHVPPEQCNCSFGTMPVNEIPMYIANGMVSANRTGVTASFLMYLLGGLVLIVTCMNYANLATAQAAARAKEIGMRRVVGASRAQVATQFLFEAGLLVGVAMLVTIGLISAALSASRAPQTVFVLHRILSSPQTWIGLIELLVATTLIAGAYPALYLSRIKPVAAVQLGRQKSPPRKLSRVLVGVQFALASFLLIAVLVMSAQTSAIKRGTISGDLESLVVLENNLRITSVSMDSLQTELSRQPHIKSVTGFHTRPWSAVIGQLRITTSPEDTSPPRLAMQNIVGFDFFKTLDMKLLAGRVFDRDHSSDISKWKESATAAVVIDQAMARLQGWNDPQQAVGKTLYMRGGLDPTIKPRQLNVIGVVEGKMLGIFSINANSNVYLLDPDSALVPIVRISKDDSKAAMLEIDSVWNKLAPSVAIARAFPSDIVARTYKILGGFAAAISAFSILACFSALLGLVGVSVHIIGRRTHEIGVRKTLGASSQSIFSLLMRDFARPVVIANLIAWPFAFLAMRAYLNFFAERSALSLKPFLLSMIISVLVAWLAVAAQTLRAARIKPAEVLRYE